MQLHELGSAITEIRERLQRIERAVEHEPCPPSSSPTGERLLKADEVQSRLNISRTTLWQMRRRGEISAVSIGRSVRFRESDVAALVADGGVEVQK